jgi:Fe-S oxidoreductase
MDVNALCCGAGGGVADAYPDFALHTADHRLEEAADLGAEAIIAACPYCRDNLSHAAREGGRQIEAYDITEILFHSITGKGGF